MNREVKTLKDALHDTIHKHPRLSVRAIAEEINMGESYLYKSALPDPDTDGPNASGCRFPLKFLVPLIKATDDYQLIDTIEKKLGRVAIPVPTSKSVETDDICLKSIQAAAEFGDLMREIGESVKDGKITLEEKQRIAKEGWEAVQEIMKIVCSCEQPSR